LASHSENRELGCVGIIFSEGTVNLLDVRVKSRHNPRGLKVTRRAEAGLRVDIDSGLFGARAAE
jgi:hypothetical protein